jgi:hypothetical protein
MRALPPNLGSFRTKDEIRRYLGRLVRRFELPASAISIRRRMASERDGLSFCRLAQFSIANLVVGESLTVSTGSRPVAGRPGLLGIPFLVDEPGMFW